MESIFVDIIPPHLKTPEGAERAMDAIRKNEDATALVANLATQFIADWQFEIADPTLPDLMKDLQELQQTIRERAKTQDEMLKTIAGRS